MRDIVVSTVVIVLLLFSVSLQFLTIGSTGSGSNVPPEQIRKYAAALESQMLYKQATQEYQRYLQVSNDPPEQRANILYKIGTIYLDQMQDYENALAAFLQVSTIYPGAPIAREAEKRMIPCLEHLNRTFDAQKKLKKLTDLEPEEEIGTGPVVAKIGDKEITLDQLERDIAQLPESVRSQFAAPERKLEFLQNKVFMELLYDMAQRKEYDKDSQFRQQIHEMEKNLLASRVLQEEVAQKIAIAPSDIETYYLAHQQEFNTPESRLIAHIEVDSASKAQEARQAIQEGMDFKQAVNTYSMNETSKSREGMLGYVKKDDDLIPGLGTDKALVERLMTLSANEISEPIEFQGATHLFRVEKIQPAETHTLEDVKQQVEQQVRTMKERELQQELMKKLLDSDRVKIFNEAIQPKTQK